MHLFQSYSIDKNCTQLDKRGERTGGSGLRNMIPTRQLLPNNYSLVWIEWMNEIEDTVQCKEHRNVRTETETILNHSLSWFYRRSKRSRAGKWLAPNHCGGRPGVSIQVILVIVLVFWMKKSHTHTLHKSLWTSVLYQMLPNIQPCKQATTKILEVHSENGTVQVPGITCLVSPKKQNLIHHSVLSAHCLIRHHPSMKWTILWRCLESDR